MKPFKQDDSTVVLYFDHILHDTPKHHVENQDRYAELQIIVFLHINVIYFWFTLHRVQTCIDALNAVLSSQSVFLDTGKENKKATRRYDID